MGLGNMVVITSDVSILSNKKTGTFRKNRNVTGDNNHIFTLKGDKSHNLSKGDLMLEPIPNIIGDNNHIFLENIPSVFIRLLSIFKVFLLMFRIIFRHP
jgi:hypothetical protein